MEDQELLAKIQNEESRNYGFNLLVRKYQERIYWLIRKMVIDHDDTDDLVQEVFIKVWQHLDQYRADSKLYTWIYRIAVNEALGFLRKKRSRFLLPVVNVEKELAQKVDDSHYIDGDEVQKKLQKAILSLPEKQRLVFNLKYYEAMKYDDMAEILGGSVGSLKASYHHAVKKIEGYLNDD